MDSFRLLPLIWTLQQIKLLTNKTFEIKTCDLWEHACWSCLTGILSWKAAVKGTLSWKGETLKWQLFSVCGYEMWHKCEAEVSSSEAEEVKWPRLISHKDVRTAFHLKETMDRTRAHRLMMCFYSHAEEGQFKGLHFSCKDYSAGDINVLVMALKQRYCSHWQNIPNSLAHQPPPHPPSTTSFIFLIHKFAYFRQNCLQSLKQWCRAHAHRKRGSQSCTYIPLTNIRHVKLAFIFSSRAAPPDRWEL